MLSKTGVYDFSDSTVQYYLAPNTGVLTIRFRDRTHHAKGPLSVLVQVHCRRLLGRAQKNEGGRIRHGGHRVNTRYGSCSSRAFRFVQFSDRSVAHVGVPDGNLMRVQAGVICLDVSLPAAEEEHFSLSVMRVIREIKIHY